jgi:hypothetical protein
VGKQSVLLRIAVLLLAVAAGLNIAYLWMQSSNPSDTTYPESLTLHWIRTSAAGESVYQDYNQPPFNPAPYTPVYYWTMGALQRTFHLDLDATARTGRHLAILCAALLACLLAWAARKEGWELAAVGALIFLSAPVLWPWACSNRPDLMGCLLAMAGYLLHTRASGRAARALSVPVLILAVFTKQTLIAAPAALVIHRWRERGAKAAAGLALQFILGIGAVAAALQWATGGLFLLNVWGVNRNPLMLDAFATVGSAFLVTAALPLVLGLAGGMVRGWKNPDTLYFAFAFAFAAASAAKWGSNVNYFIEPLIVACLLIPAGLKWAFERLEFRGAMLFAAAAAVVALPQIHGRLASMRAVDFQEHSELRTFASQTHHPILTDDPRVGLWTPRPFMLEPFQLLCLEQAGLWSADKAVEMVRARAFEAVVLSVPLERHVNHQWHIRFPQRILEEIQADYVYSARMDGYYVYVPKPPSS